MNEDKTRFDNINEILSLLALLPAGVVFGFVAGIVASSMRTFGVCGFGSSKFGVTKRKFIELI